MAEWVSYEDAEYAMDLAAYAWAAERDRLEPDEPAPQCFVTCSVCDGTGDSGEVQVNEAPRTWDDPGYYEVDPIPCFCCGGTGLEQLSEAHNG
jgi:hypothetical protein